MTKQVNRPFSHQKPPIYWPVSSGALYQERQQKNRTCKGEVEHETTEKIEKNKPPLGHTACRQDDQGRGSYNL